MLIQAHGLKKMYRMGPTEVHALQGVDLVAPIPSTEFQFVAAVNPAERAGEVKRILKRVARSRNRIAHRGVTRNLDERRTGSASQSGLVLKTQF